MKLSKGILQVVLANIINLIISVGNGFLLPKYLSIESYADFKTFILYISYVGVLHFGYIDGIYIKYGGKTISEIDAEEFACEKKALALFQLAITLPLMSVALFFKNFNLLFAALSALPINMISFFKFVYQATGEFKEYRRITNLSAVLIFIWNLIFLFLIKTDIALWYIGIQVAASFAVWFVYEHKNRIRHIHENSSIKNIWFYMNRNIRIGITIMLGNFMGIWITGIDRWFIKILCNAAEFAYYSFAVSMLRLINVAVTAFSITLYNFFCKKPEKEEIGRMRIIVLIVGAAMIALIFPLHFIVRVYLVKYIKAIPAIIILFAAQFILTAVNAIYLNLYKAHNLQKKYLTRMIEVTAAAFLFNLVMGYLWNNDIAAYAAATLMTAVLWLVLCQRDLPEQKMQIREWAYIVLTILGYFICNRLNVWLGMIIYVSWISIESILLFSWRKRCQTNFPT